MTRPKKKPKKPNPRHRRPRCARCNAPVDAHAAQDHPQALQPPDRWGYVPLPDDRVRLDVPCAHCGRMLSQGVPRRAMGVGLLVDLRCPGCHQDTFGVLL